MNHLELCEHHLRAAGIHLDDDFHALPASQVSVLVELAKAVDYRPSKNANGSLARCFYERLQRLYFKR